jgi:hypothetical protein
VPLLILGHDQGAGTHAAHELGSFDLALAIAFAVGAIRPACSATASTISPPSPPPTWGWPSDQAPTSR